VPTPLPITGGLEGTPGGVPLYKGGHLVGGVGIAATASPHGHHAGAHRGRGLG